MKFRYIHQRNNGYNGDTRSTMYLWCSLVTICGTTAAYSGRYWFICIIIIYVSTFSTGPVLIFEASLYTLCNILDIDFLTIRLWAGVWLLLMALVTVAFHSSFLLKYVTRFTEDIFATLISIIFIAESIKFLNKVSVNNDFTKCIYLDVHTAPSA
jgi:hypothetical protein